MQRPSYKVFNYTLKAGEQVNIHHRANSLNCLSASARFQIAFDDAPLTTFEKGLGYNSPVPFSKVRLLNDSAETIKIELGFASGGITDSRLNLPSAIDANITNETLKATVTGEVDANITGGRLEVTNEVKVKLKFAASIDESTVAAAANAQTKLVDFRANRKDLFITNLGDATVFLGGPAAGNNKGLPLGAGKTAALQCKAEARVWNPTDTAIDLAVMEMFG